MKTHGISLSIRILMLVSALSFYTNDTKAYEKKDSNLDQTIFVGGTELNAKFVQYLIDLTEKMNPQICYVPTASADNVDNITYWKSICEKLSIEPHILNVWVESMRDTIPFENTLLGMDAIVVGGGNTLNMIGIWKAQGIDSILEKAYKKGIILAGGSAGSICWFQEGVSDSRPAKLSIVSGLSFLPYSHCPHYGDSIRRTLFQQKILKKKIKEGYACDNLSGILFKNGKVAEVVSTNELNHSYHISEKQGALKIEKLESKILLNKDALQPAEYDKIDINKNLRKCIIHPSNDIIEAFVNFIKKITKDDNLDKIIDNTHIFQVMIYKDALAAVINKREYDFYCISLFYKQNNIWIPVGEDIGDTPFQSEISFRERARMHSNRLDTKYKKAAN